MPSKMALSVKTVKKTSDESTEVNKEHRLESLQQNKRYSRNMTVLKEKIGA